MKRIHYKAEKDKYIFTPLTLVFAWWAYDWIMNHHLDFSNVLVHLLPAVLCLAKAGYSFRLLYLKKICTSCGTGYNGTIIEKIRHMHRNYFTYSLRIKYSGREFITPRINESAADRISSKKCTVHEYRGKCWADGFQLRTKHQ